MIRLDALTRRRGPAKKDTSPKKVTVPKPDRHIEINPVDHEEPTWEVRHPGDSRRHQLDGRTRAILSGAAAAALVVNAGAAWTYWRITDSPTAGTNADTVVELALRARSDLNVPLLPGRTGDLVVTVTNNNNYPIRITSVTAGAGKVVADAEHREAGCKDPGVVVARLRFDVSWEVQRNTVGAFTIADGLTMRSAAESSCAGGIFTIPVRVAGVSRKP